ncbi:hypothetical protein N657DRAFT_657349 [Parathielavia appendiculata]|uniref:RING-type E3 ubiquitin transferase n=1 Tax=Parathielavia appendiculata TaxID=2587402 RepID=A0AAN6TWH4_9PEZI|nr:hypothetical protein N657DRAFT_657349 [Parathielavia appendiculata]
MASSWCIFFLSFLSVLQRVCAEDVRISSKPEPSVWEVASLMHLQLTAPESEALQLTYSVYPLTEHAGLNRTDRSSIWIRGSLIAAGVPANAERLSDTETIAFLSCDGENATQEVNQLIGASPKAILLYSVDGNACSLEGDDLNYGSIYTMGDSAEARDTMNNTIRAGGVLRATITGNSNMTSTLPGTREQSGSNSAVAMSILYSITGLITLLFLVIIGTGAIRAHRYPERYGPRSGYGGRPSQSRARGLARAVLETLPIVKFGDPSPAKPDPSLELESQPSATGPDPTMGTRLSAIPEEPRTPQVHRSDAPPMSGAVPGEELTATGAQAELSGAWSEDRVRARTHGRPSEEHLGCSICTEDFTVGEDVRVLPCDHKFHPPCIDPWLINVSGTCPLCRLDLRPQSRLTRDGSVDPDDPFLVAPPLVAAENWADHENNNNNSNPTISTVTSTQQHYRRSSLFLDLHRLRHASIEERIEILRRHRARQQQQQQQQRESAAVAGGGETEEQRGRRARLADRLRERLRIRTRTLSPPRAEGVEQMGTQASTLARV